MVMFLGVMSDTIQLANAFGWETPGQKKLNERLQAVVRAESDQLREDVKIEIRKSLQTSQDYAGRVAESVQTALNEQLRERVDPETFSDEESDLLIKLLLAVRVLKGKVILALVIKYKVGDTTVTNGFALTSYGRIKDMIESVTKAKRALAYIDVPVTAYLAVRVRGRHSPETEHHGLGILGLIASGCLGLNAEIRREVAHSSMFEPVEGGCLIYLMRDVEAEEPKITGGSDSHRRVMLLGDTRTGKSTVGNALMGSESFRVAQGMTGTMHIDKGVTLQQSENGVIVTEYYDTPGLNDRDGLDPMYEAAIEDKIVTLKRVSTLVVTVSIDGGLTHSFDKALGEYQRLFGTDMFGMLIVVLTVNENISEQRAKHNIEINWPNIAGKSKLIRKSRVYCIGLKDLRDSVRSSGASGKALAGIHREILSGRLVLISSIREHYTALEQEIRTKKDLEENQVEKLVDDGWQCFEELEKKYLTKPHVKVGEKVAGFVMKQDSVFRCLLKEATGGLCNTVRKYVIMVNPAGEKANKCWRMFLQTVPAGSRDRLALRVFGNMIPMVSPFSSERNQTLMRRR